MPKPDSERKRKQPYKDQKKICVIATEDSNTGGREYFNNLKIHEIFKDKISFFDIVIVPSDGDSAPNHVLENARRKMKERIEGRLFKNNNIFVNNRGDSAWIVCDTDRWKLLIDKVIAECHKYKINHAFSNPCFEIWILLHQKEFQASFDKSKDCKKAANSFVSDNGKRQVLDSEDKYQHIISEENLDYAIVNAKALDNYTKNFPETIGSHIYKLIEYLLL